MAIRQGLSVKRNAVAVSIILAVVLLAVSLVFAQKAGTRQKPTGSKPEAVARPHAPTWKSVDELVSQQKFEAASEAAEKILASARARGDEADWTKALVTLTQLRVGLHGYETAVRRLREEPWPPGPLSQATLNLFYAHAIVTYCQMYSWEIGHREKVEARGAVDLKSWTRGQLYAEAQRAYLDVWKERAALGGDPVSILKEYIRPNDYPAGIRDTLRDAVSYLYVELLADSSFWTAEQSNDIFTLDLAALLADGPSGPEAEAVLRDAKAHPLQKIVAVLGDLEVWHGARGQKEAQLEARLERLRRLHEHLEEAPDRAALKKDLEYRLPGFRGVPWWSMGQALLASFVQEEESPDALVRARALALEGWKAYPKSPGGQRCDQAVQAIQAPDFSLEGMALDGPGNRSMAVHHKNLRALYFRAYPVDLMERIQTSRDYNLLPQWQEVKGILGSQKPASAWSLNLPETPDYREHRTFLAPVSLPKGAYIVAASAREDFKEAGNRVLAIHLTLSDLVLMSRQEEDGGLEVTALDGTTGRPVAGADVALYEYNWSQGHRMASRQVTAQDGTVRFANAPSLRGKSFFLLGRHGNDLSLDTAYIGFYEKHVPGETAATLVYTDRSIYRPGQKILWKVLAYRGVEGQGPKACFPHTALTLTLKDGNNQVVGTATVSTNDFGTAAGEFPIPAGKVLGSWRIETSLNGGAGIRVEEYKRPTFEVSFKEPSSPLRLNRPAALVGQANYYFGLPVVSGTVAWRVTRLPVYPWWWGWYGWGGRAKVQTVASGTASLKEDGTFTVVFTPAADERESASKDVTYRYAVSADVTDEGGETRSANKGFRLGFVSVETRLEFGTAFFLEGSAGQVTATRTDLNGAPRPGEGSWRLVALVQPPRALLPAQQPMPKPRAGKDAGYHTPGDLERPRWEANYTVEAVLRLWDKGAEKGKGTLEHDAKGEAEIHVPPLPSGAYRLLYETTDDFGAACETSKDFVVAAAKENLAVPAVLLAESASVPVGGTARFLVHSGLPDQILFVDVYRGGRRIERRLLTSGTGSSLIEMPVTEGDRGGFGMTLTVLRGHQVMQSSQSVFVPWDNKDLKVEFATFRDKMRPGAKETWRVTVKAPGGKPVEARAAEILAYMYDRSLDLFAPYNPPRVTALYPSRAGAGTSRTDLGQAGVCYSEDQGFVTLPSYPTFRDDALIFLEGYGIGGPGRRGGGGLMGGGRSEVMVTAAAPMMAPAPPPGMAKATSNAPTGKAEDKYVVNGLETTEAKPAESQAVELRSNFAETAFWEPQLLTGTDGSAAIEFTVPDSVTSWNVWVHAVTKGMEGGSLHKEARSVKDLMVRPYLPRFLREGDRADIKVVVNNASDHAFTGTVTFDILDPGTNQSLLSKFGLDAASATKPFTVAKGGGTDLAFPLAAPVRVGTVAFKVTAVSGDTSDGELRPLPVLPGRMHLMQSRFVTLKDKDRKELTFADLANNDDPTLVNEEMVVTLDAQLFYSVLSALPYLVNYPYECTEQTLNRFLSTGILTSLYGQYPAVGKMAKEFSKRQTPLETWDSADPNRRMELEETPWLLESRGGKDAGLGTENVLDPRVAQANRDLALAKLRKAQTAIGGFPWWPGGPPSPYMTLYILYGFSKGLEFQVEAPRDVVERAWGYMHQHYLDEVVRHMMDKDTGWEFVTFLNYTLSNYPDMAWTGGLFTEAERTRMLDFSFKHWKQHSPYSKCQLALTLKRMGRARDAALVFSSVMDSAKTTPDQGTFWAHEDRGWLWYNDTVETHAFALRTLMEVTPNDPKRDGLVQWIFMNKKLNHWESTKATAEVIYSLVHYLKAEGALGTREDATVRVCNEVVHYTFEPDTYTGKKAQTVIPGSKIDPRTCSTVVVEKDTKGLMFASATWLFSTEKLPAEARGDFLSVRRTYYKRENSGGEWVLKPLAEGVLLKPGDEVEVHLSIRSKLPCEYIHLRDPRAAGLEPEDAVSRYKWDLGISWYEETRDSGSDFFFEWLPQGEYTFTYRLRANMAGTFKVSPAILQSLYAPEFGAYSAGAVITVKGS